MLSTEPFKYRRMIELLVDNELGSVWKEAGVNHEGI
jgi:hypothetical protein